MAPRHESDTHAQHVQADVQAISSAILTFTITAFLPAYLRQKTLSDGHLSPEPRPCLQCNDAMHFACAGPAALMRHESRLNYCPPRRHSPTGQENDDLARLQHKPVPMSAAYYRDIT